MRYYLDTEFNGFGGALLALAMHCEDGRSLNLRRPDQELAGMQLTPWVIENVIPVLDVAPDPAQQMPVPWARLIGEFLSGDASPVVFADWPDDIRHFCEQLLLASGCMIPVQSIDMHLVPGSSFPTSLNGAVQHNAWWDAMALWHKLG